MSRSQAFIVNGRLFPTKTAVIERTQAILNSSPNGVPIAGPEFDFLLDLFSNHPRAKDKFGGGVLSIEAMTAPGWKSRCFSILRADGTRVEISYKECITPTSPTRRFREAARHAIVDQILEFKDRAFGTKIAIPCAITGEPVCREQCHVDHHPVSFEELVTRFLVEEGVDVEQVEYLGWDPMETRMRFKDPILMGSWQEFHRMFADLQVTTVKANVTKRRSSLGKN